MIPNQTTSQQYLLNGTTTAFSFNNKVFNATDLAITLFDAATPANAYVFLWTSGSTFTCATLGMTALVSNIDVDTGCTVTLSNAGTAGWTLDVRTTTPGTQGTSIKNQGSFLPDLHEEAFDLITRRVQDLFRLTYLFGIHGPDTEVLSWPALPNAFNRQNTVVGFDAGGLPTVIAQSALGGGGGGSTPSGGIVYTLASQPSILVPADSSGNVTSFALAHGVVQVYSGSNNVTANCAFSIVTAANCTGTVNTSANNPVVGGAIGYYQITAMSADVAALTVRASYNGSNYDTVISFAKVKAGATGVPGPTGPTGSTGAPGSGTTAISIYLTNPSMSVFAYANGSVVDFSKVNGTAIVLSGTSNVSESCTYSAVGVNCTGTVNTADNTPVNGQPIGYYQITAMSGTLATLTITAVYSGATLTQTFTVTTAQAGFEIVGTLPVTNLFQGRMVFLTTDNKLYRYTGTAWTPAVAATDVTGQLTAAQIASITAAQLTGTITTSQVTPGAITTPLLAAAAVSTANLAAGAVTTATLAASAVTAAKIAAGTITATQIASNTITTNLIQAGAITAALISVTTLSALSANMGTVTAGIVQNTGGSVSLNLTTGILLFNNGSFMSVKGNGFGAGSAFIEWYGPTVSSASNYAACTTTNGLFYTTTAGASYHAGSVNYVTGSNGNGTYVKLPADKSGRVYIQQYGASTSTGVDPNTITFPIAFPTACISVVMAPVNAGAGGFTTTLNGLPGLSSASVYTGGKGVTWSAFGY